MGETPRKSSGTQDKQHGSPSLDELRDEIEEIDEQIVENITRRTYVAESIAEVKLDEGMEINDPKREKKVLERVRDRAESLDVDPQKVEEIFEILMEISKEKQRSVEDES